MWCKPGQYLDYKKCVCKNKLIGRVIAECTSVINETMMNNVDNKDNNNLYFCWIIFNTFIWKYLILRICLF